MTDARATDAELDALIAEIRRHPGLHAGAPTGLANAVTWLRADNAELRRQRDDARRGLALFFKLNRVLEDQDGTYCACLEPLPEPEPFDGPRCCDRCLGVIS